MDQVPECSGRWHMCRPLGAANTPWEATLLEIQQKNNWRSRDFFTCILFDILLSLVKFHTIVPLRDFRHEELAWHVFEHVCIAYQTVNWLFSLFSLLIKRLGDCLFKWNYNFPLFQTSYLVQQPRSKVTVQPNKLPMYHSGSFTVFTVLVCNVKLVKLTIVEKS